MSTTVHQPLIRAKNLSLQIPVYHQRDRSLLKNPFGMISELYLSSSQRTTSEILSGVNLEVHKGEKIGIIGVNGAGKSTLLKVLAGIYTPTGGDLAVAGSIKGLFDISLGMMPEATGLENIYLRGLQMGLTMTEIRALVQDVIEFSELAPYIHMPHNTYSAGMRLRLAFSISTAIHPDILLLDEWIGAGDASFRDKVAERMMSLIDNSNALVLATHNDNLMLKLCSRGIVMSGGKIVFDGETGAALEFYHNSKDVALTQAG